jgi:hypothetical protein
LRAYTWFEVILGKHTVPEVVRSKLPALKSSVWGKPLCPMVLV